MGTYVINRAANIAGGLGGGVATLIACSKKSDLDQFEIERTDHISGVKFRYGHWFRLWSDGWLEQGMLTFDYWGYTANEYGRLYLPLPFANTNYDIQITGDYTDSNYPDPNTNVTGFQPVVRHKSYYNFVPSLGGDDEGGAGSPYNVKITATCKGFTKPETIPNILAGKIWTATAQSMTVVEPVWIDDPNA